MLGIGEVLILGVIALLFGGGGAATLLRGLRTEATRRAGEALREEVDRHTPDELKEAAKVVRDVRQGRVPDALLGHGRSPDVPSEGADVESDADERPR